MVRDENGVLKPAGLGLNEMFKKLPEFQYASCHFVDQVDKLCEDLFFFFLLIRHPDMPQWDLIQWDPALDSSDFTSEEWIRLANDIGKHYYEFDGFVVLHGTDTMAYSASALSFMLENLSKPVIFTGAQVPLGAIYNDAKRNLIVSILLAGKHVSLFLAKSSQIRLISLFSQPTLTFLKCAFSLI
jgi:hypothetical protein